MILVDNPKIFIVAGPRLGVVDLVLEYYLGSVVMENFEGPTKITRQSKLLVVNSTKRSLVFFLILADGRAEKTDGERFPV